MGPPAALAFLPVPLRERFSDPVLLGQGAFGVVLRVLDVRLARPVALKLLDPQPSVSGEGETSLATRFEREARLAATLSSPHLVAVLDAGTCQGHRYLVAELVEAEDLARYLARHPEGLPVAQALDILRQILEGLAVVHAAAIVHRDLKPANVLLTEDGVVKITDFGLARHHDDDTLTRTGALVGTPIYLAPEQLAGADATPAGDVYACGVLLSLLLTGHHPFGDFHSPSELWNRKRAPDVPDLGAAAARIPAPVRGLVAQLMALDPARRPADAAAALRAMERARPTPGSGVHGALAVASQATLAPAGRLGPRVAAGVLGLLALALGSWWGAATQADPPSPPPGPSAPPQLPSDLDEIEQALEDLQALPAVRKALEITTELDRAEAKELWGEARLVIRQQLAALEPRLRHLAGLAGSPRLLTVASRLIRLADLFDQHALEDVPPLFPIGREPPLEALLAPALRVAREPRLPGAVGSELEVRAAFLEAERVSGGRTWSLLRDEAGYRTLDRGKVVYDNGVLHQTPGGVAFVDPRLVEPETQVGSADFLGEAFRDGMSRSFAGYPRDLELPLRPFPDDLCLALDIERWEHTTVMEIEVQGAGPPLRLTVRRPGRGARLPYRGGLLLRLRRAFLPPSPARVLIRAFGLQPVSTPHQVSRLNEVFQLVAGDPPLAVSGDWPEG